MESFYFILFVVYLLALSIHHIIKYSTIKRPVKRINGKGCGRKQSWPDLQKIQLSHLPGGATENHDFHQDDQFWTEIQNYPFPNTCLELYHLSQLAHYYENYKIGRIHALVADVIILTFPHLRSVKMMYLATINAGSFTTCGPTLTCPCCINFVAMRTEPHVLFLTIITGSRRRQKDEAVTSLQSDKSHFVGIRPNIYL